LLGGKQSETAAQTSQAAPSAADKQVLPSPEAREVSGVDLGPARYPGLRRTAFERNGATASASYQGSGNLADVLAHYQSGFAAMGFQSEVLSASTDAERHQFVMNEQRVELEVSQGANGAIEVVLNQHS
jgi:hypothetical protein